MRILFYSPETDQDAWVTSFADVMPEVDLHIWRESDTFENSPACDYAVLWRPPEALLRNRSDFKAIFNLGAGVDSLLQFDDSLPENIPIIRLDDAGMGVQMAEYVSYSVLRYFRRFDEYEMQARAGQWAQLKPHDKRDFTIGILGLGVLGRRVAQALAHFEFPVRGWSHTIKDIEGITCFAGKDGLDEFLRGTKVLICVLPLTSETSNMLGRANLAKLPQGAYLINVARGAHVAEAELLAAIKSGQLAGATLDVFRNEPLPAPHPFWSEPRIHITPHIAALTLRNESVRQVASKIAALERGEPITGVVNRLKGY